MVAKSKTWSPIALDVQLQEQAGLRMLRDRVEFIPILSNPIHR